MSHIVRYPHLVTIQEPGGGGTRDPAGRWVPAPETVVYRGPADVQDAGAVLSRDMSGQPVLTSDAKMTIPPGAKVLKPIKPKQTVTIDWQTGELSDAEIVQHRRLDGATFLRFL